MELCYRGISYESNFRTVPIQKNVHTVSLEENRLIIGKYRGVIFQLHPFTPAASPPAFLKLTYRGTTYPR
jgi:hypothetical protein